MGLGLEWIIRRGDWGACYLEIMMVMRGGRSWWEVLRGGGCEGF
jgi:hypothetical protein